MIDQLSKSDFQVTAITRDAQKAKASLQAAPDMDIVQGDYTSAQSLAPCLRGHDAVVSLILRGQPDPQILVIDATIIAKVPHMITSSFGIDLQQEYLRSLPPFKGKVQMGDYVAQKARDGLITFNSIQTGIFFGWGLSLGMMINLKDDGVPSVLFDDGETKFSVSAEKDIATAVAAALRKKDKLPMNCSLFIQTAAVRQNQLRHYAKELRPAREFPVTVVDTAKEEKNAWAAYNTGERDMGKLGGFMSRGTFGMGLGLFKHLDNDVLGIEERDEEWLKAFIARHM